MIWKAIRQYQQWDELVNGNYHDAVYKHKEPEIIGQMVSQAANSGWPDEPSIQKSMRLSHFQRTEPVKASPHLNLTPPTAGNKQFEALLGRAESRFELHFHARSQWFSSSLRNPISISRY